MLAELFARGRRRIGHFDLCRTAFEVVLENMFDGARLAGDFRETKEERLGKAARVNREDGDGLFFG